MNMRNTILIYLFTLFVVSCSSTRLSKNHKDDNFFAIRFRSESPAAISCDYIQTNYDTSFYLADSSITRIINNRVKELKLSKKRFSDFRIKIIPQNKSLNNEICIDIGGQLTIGEITYEKDDIILNQLLAYLPKDYR